MDMDLAIVIKRAHELTEVEQQGVDSVSGLAFAEDITGQEYTWSNSDWQVVGSLVGKVVTCLGIVDRDATAGSQPLRLGGIGGVATHPEWQQRGLASALMLRANAFMRDEMKVDFGLLVCGEQRRHFYAGLGWQEVKGPLMVDQPSGKVELKAVIMVLPCCKHAWPEGVIDLCGLPW
jgi:aminoglycoside 2'-N-acetyltransferase I